MSDSGSLFNEDAADHMFAVNREESSALNQTVWGKGVTADELALWVLDLGRESCCSSFFGHWA